MAEPFEADFVSQQMLRMTVTFDNSSGIIAFLFGEMPERLNGAVSKTVIGLVPIVGSNPTLSALFVNEEYSL